MTDFPDGDGLSDCSACRGRGAIDFTPPGAVMPGVIICSCVRDRDIKANMQRGWRGLADVPPPPGMSPLREFVEQDLWVTSSTGIFRRHLYDVAYNQGPNWRFQVSSDADLMDAWLSRIDDTEIFDPDVDRIRHQRVSHRYPALVDLVEPPALLILCVSVKVARNVAMPEVLLEALQHRSHTMRPTWVVDDPNRQLVPGHIAYSEAVDDHLAEWEHQSFGKRSAE